MSAYLFEPLTNSTFGKDTSQLKILSTNFINFDHKISNKDRGKQQSLTFITVTSKLPLLILSPEFLQHHLSKQKIHWQNKWAWSTGQNITKDLLARSKPNPYLTHLVSIKRKISFLLFARTSKGPCFTKMPVTVKCTW